MRTEAITVDDVAAAGQVLHALTQARIEVEDLRERCLRKGDTNRAQELKIAGFRVQRASEIVEEAFS